MEIAKALSRDASVVIFDEPTASLTSVEEEHLFGLIGRLRDRGTAIVYVSHRLDEIFAICDVVTVLKDGRLVGTMPASELDHHALVEPDGRPRPARGAVPAAPPGAGRDGPPLLRVVGASSPGRIEGVSLQVWPGEIVGLAGLIGSGGPRCCAPSSGRTRARVRTVSVDDVEVGHSPVAAIAAGIAYVTEDRRSEGLAIDLTQPRQPRVDDAVGRRLALRRARHRGIPPPRSPPRSVSTPGVLDQRSGSCPAATSRRSWWASGWPSSPACCSATSPPAASTWAPRPRSTACSAELADAGVGILLASSELPEILGIADRVLVMRDGRLVAEFADGVPTEEQVMRAAAMDQVEVTA